MKWKYQDGEPVYFCIGMVVHQGAIAYTSALPAISDEGEELYQISLEDNVKTVTGAGNIFRAKEPAIAAALVEIEKQYGVYVREYLNLVRALTKVQ